MDGDTSLAQLDGAAMLNTFQEVYMQESDLSDQIAFRPTGEQLRQFF